MENLIIDNIKLDEGKTKVIYQYAEDKNLVIIHSKDRITAGDGARSNDLQGKAEISNETASNIFKLLNDSGINTHFVRKISSTEFLAFKCEMIPIEFVIRRIATGSFLKRNPGVEEGYKFCPPKLEYFFKDDENHDPQWSREQLICNFSKREFGASRRIISAIDIDIIDRVTRTVFEILEKYWSDANCQLVDMKIEFGYNEQSGEILLGDIIDSDSWRLWPHGDKKLMVDKQVYRDLQVVTDGDLKTVLKNFTWVSDKIKEFCNQKGLARIVVIMGSPTDLEFSKEIDKYCQDLEVECLLRIASAHKQPSVVEQIASEFEGDGYSTVFIAVAGRSNGLGPVLAGLTTSPVINCPPIQPSWGAQDIWSSLRLPSGLGCSTVLGTDTAALSACRILALSDCRLWARLKAKQLDEWIRLIKADSKIMKRAGEISGEK